MRKHKKYRYGKKQWAIFEEIPKGIAIFLIVAGSFIGTVFTSELYYWERPIQKEDAVKIEAAFQSYKECHTSGRGGGSRYIILYVEGYDQLEIRSSCASDRVFRKIEKLEPGTILTLYIHPNSNTILAMSEGDNQILSFRIVMDQLFTESIGFFILGLFMYFGAALGLIKIIRKKVF